MNASIEIYFNWYNSIILKYHKQHWNTFYMKNYLIKCFGEEEKMEEKFGWQKEKEMSYTKNDDGRKLIAKRKLE